MDIKTPMELAGRNLLDGLLPENDHLPIWSARIHSDLTLTVENRWYSHNVGRWWDALLRLEAATGFELPAEAESAMLGHLRACLDNPLGVCCRIGGRLPTPDYDPPPGGFDEHSQRETLLALAALVTRRGSDWAAEAGGRMVRALDRFILADGRWDLSAMGIGETDADPADVRSVQSHGRMIEGLLAFYDSAGDPAALALAGRLAELHLALSTRPGGAGPPRELWPGLHTHSLLGTYRGLLRYGLLTRQAEFVERVAQTYRVTVRQHVKPSGFISHDWGKDTMGETTSPGDAAQLALRLAREGHTAFLDDAERIVRARILPSQIIRPPDVRYAEGQPAPQRDPRALVRGAFGGCHLHPHGGINPTTDVTAADLHTLCDIYHHIAERSAAGLTVNFHFDYAGPGVRIRSREAGARREVDLRWDPPGNLFLRIPRWADRRSVSLRVGESPVPLQMAGDFACLPGRATGETHAVVAFDLPVRRIREWTKDTDFEFTWRGDTVQGIRPNAPFLPFYGDG